MARATRPCWTRSMAIPGFAISLSLATLGALLGPASAATCPPVKAISDLSPAAFAGTWFEIAKSARLRFETPDPFPTKCNSMQFVLPKQSAGKPTVFHLLMSGNESLQYMPWAYGRTDVLTAVAQLDRVICKSLNALPAALGTKTLSPDLSSISGKVGTISLQANNLGQGQVKGTSIGALASSIKAIASSIRSTSKAASSTFKGNSKAKALLASISEAAANISNAAELAKSVELVKPGFRGGNDHAGTATQSASNKGIFSVDFKSLRFLRSYSIVAVSGSAFDKYTAAVLYSCTDEGVSSREDVIVLSRSRTLAPSVYDQFMASLQKSGVTLTCDNPLVPTFQDKGPDCKMP